MSNEIVKEIEFLEECIANREQYAKEILEGIEQLKIVKEQCFKEAVLEKGCLLKSDEPVRHIAYMEALEDVKRDIEMWLSGYIDMRSDDIYRLSKELEPERIEESNVQDDLDYTCYPLDTNSDDSAETLPF